MKLIFLHGLGQSATDWQVVVNHLSDFDCQVFALFDENGFPDDFQTLVDKLTQYLKDVSEDFILVGLSLGGMPATVIF